jgi:hypothetical protein
MSKSLLIACFLVSITAICVYFATRSTRRKERLDLVGTLTDPAGAILQAATSALGAEKVADLILNINNNPNEEEEMANSAAAAGETNNTDTSGISDDDGDKTLVFDKGFTTGEFVTFSDAQIYDANIPKPDPSITPSDMSTICTALNTNFTSAQLNNLQTKERTVADLLTTFQCPQNTNTVPSSSNNPAACNLIKSHFAKTDPYMNTASLMLKCDLPLVQIVDKNNNCLDQVGRPFDPLKFKPCRNPMPTAECQTYKTAMQKDLATVTQKRDEAQSDLNYAKFWYDHYNDRVTKLMSDVSFCVNEASQYNSANAEYDAPTYFTCQDMIDSAAKEKSIYDTRYQNYKLQLGNLNDEVSSIESMTNIDCNVQTKDQTFFYAPYDYTIKSLSDAYGVYTTPDNAQMCMTLRPLQFGGEEIVLTPCKGSVQQMFRVNSDVNNLVTEDKTKALQNASLSNAVMVKSGNLCLTANTITEGSQLRWGACGQTSPINQMFKLGANNNLQTFSVPSYCIGVGTDNNYNKDFLILKSGNTCATDYFFRDGNGNLQWGSRDRNTNIPLSNDIFNPGQARLQTSNQFGKGTTTMPGNFVPASDYLLAGAWKIGDESMYFKVKPIGLTPAVWVESWISGKGVPADTGLGIQDLFYAINNTEDRSQYYFLKANKTQFWVKAPFKEDRMLGYVSGKKVGYLFRDGRWDVFKRFVTNQGLPLEYTCNWFTRAGGVLDSLKEKAKQSGNSEIMQELLSGLILEGTKISTMVSDRSEVFGGQGGSVSKDYSEQGFRSAYVKYSDKINSVQWIKQDGSWMPQHGGDYGDDRREQLYSQNNQPTKTLSGRINVYTTRKCMFGVYCKEYPDPSKMYIANLGFEGNPARIGNWPALGNFTKDFFWSCPDSSQYINQINTRSGAVVDAIQVQCTPRKVTIGYVDDNHVGQLKTPEGDWIPIGAMFTLIGNVPTMQEGFAFINPSNASNASTGSREGYGCGWSAPWDCAEDLYKSMVGIGSGVIGFIKDQAGNVFNTVKDFVVNAAMTVGDWAKNLGTSFYEWAKSAGATFVQNMITIGNGIGDGLKAGFAYIGNNIADFVTKLGNDILDGLKKFVNVLAELAEIVKDFVMGILRKITGSMGKWWTYLKTYVAFLITKIMRGRQCLFLHYSKSEPYKALRYLVFLLANPIEIPCDSYIMKLPKLSSKCKLKGGKTQKTVRLSPGIRQPLKDQVEKFLRSAFGSIPYIGPLVNAGIYVCKLPPMVWWVDYKIDTEILVPIFDLARNEVLALFVPIINTTLGWSCKALMDVKDAIVNKMKGSVESKTTDDGNKIEQEVKDKANAVTATAS